MDKYQEIYDKAAECRKFLRVHGFLLDSENDKVWKRIDKYGTQSDLKKIQPLKSKK